MNKTLKSSNIFKDFKKEGTVKNLSNHISQNEKNKLFEDAKIEKILDFANVYKDYGKVRALDDLSLDIYQGEKVALLGSNGAGKSSFLGLASGLKKVSKGSVKIFNEDPHKLEVKKRMTYLPQELGFPENLKVKEIISIIESHHEYSEAKMLISELGLSSLLERKTFQLSGGERRKLGLICNLLSSPDFVMLDEPTSNIDVEGRQQIEDILQNYFKNDKRTLLFSSHQMNEVEKLADRIVILRAGKIVAQGPTEEIKKEFGAKKVIFHSNKHFKVESGKSQEVIDGKYTILGEDSDKIIKEIIRVDPLASNISIENPHLEEILMKLWNKEYIQ